MTPSLQTSRHIARASRHAIESASRSGSLLNRSSSIVPTFCSIRCARRYATVQPGDPKDPKNKKDGDASRKAAPGMENLYGKNSAMSGPSSGPVEGASKLSAKDEEVLKELSTMLERGMPASQRETFRKAVQAMRQEGIPADLREVMHEWKDKRAMDLATAARVVRITARFARKAAEVEMRDDLARPQQKSGPHSAGPQSSSDKQKKDKEEPFGKGFFGSGGSGGGGFKDIKLDTGTVLTSAFVAYMLYRSAFPGQNSRSITWQEFRTQYLDRGLVEKLTVVNKNQTRQQQMATSTTTSPSVTLPHLKDIWTMPTTNSAFPRTSAFRFRMTTRLHGWQSSSLTALPSFSSVPHSGFSDDPLAVLAVDQAASSGWARAERRSSTTRLISRLASRTLPAWTRPSKRLWNLSAS
ncbi:hypothetical protein FH972_022647 [Carpinus fangiana]|uniref:Peptidase M41 FtsH extracellular domain-containing protein n=1 Tax=Carpinus fangiana TaxID=176857 RepID=A0A5N6KV34_9ROSI|nr:hypothetical protein FH972_022647 [Carpinus fangiana]